MNTSSFKDVAVVIPAFNEESKITDTILELKKYFENLIVVDDGSSDATFKIAKSTGAETLRHPINLGQGAALQTGICRALLNPQTKFILTFDADGQHSAETAIEMLYEIKKSDVEIVLGSRFLAKNTTEIPVKKKIILRLAIVFTRFNSGLAVTDTHNGLRVMKRSFAESLNIKYPGMAHASEILNHVKSVNASWKEFPAQISYTDYSKNKGQSVLNAVNILTEMIYR